MLREVLRLVETASGPISLMELSRRTGLEAGVMEGMLTYWVRKGRLRVEGWAAVCSDGCFGAGCRCGSCALGDSGCPFIARLPKSYVVNNSPITQKPTIPVGKEPDRMYGR